MLWLTYVVTFSALLNVGPASMDRSIWAAGLLIVTLAAFAAVANAANDDAALRRKCAHLVKVKLGIKDTGQVRDLAGVSGAVQQVDQCVANGGKL